MRKNFRKIIQKFIQLCQFREYNIVVDISYRFSEDINWLI